MAGHEHASRLCLLFTQATFIVESQSSIAPRKAFRCESAISPSAMNTSGGSFSLEVSEEVEESSILLFRTHCKTPLADGGSSGGLVIDDEVSGLGTSPFRLSIATSMTPA